MLKVDEGSLETRSRPSGEGRLRAFNFVAGSASIIQLIFIAVTSDLPRWIPTATAVALLMSVGVSWYLLRQLRKMRVTIDKQAQLKAKLEQVERRLQRYSGSILYLEYDASVVLAPNDAEYKLHYRKEICNIGNEELSGLVYHVDCCKFPEDRVANRKVYVDSPLTAERIGLRAWDEIGPLDVRVTGEQDNRIDFVIHLSEDGIARPIFPGNTRTVEYSYAVPITHWGSYFNRPVYNPVEVLRVTFGCPVALQPRVALAKISQHAKRPIDQDADSKTVGDQLEYTFSVDEPEIGSTYQMSWRTSGDAVGGTPGYPPDLPGRGPQS